MNVGAMFSKFENVLSSVSTIVTSVVGLVSLFYLPGFIILNLYLSSYGVRDFTLARATYLSVGSTFIVFHLVLFLLLFSLRPTISSIQKEDTVKGWLKNATTSDKLNTIKYNIKSLSIFALKIVFISFIILNPFFLLNVLQSGDVLSPVEISSSRSLYTVMVSAFILFLIWVYSRPTKYLMLSSAIFGLIIALVVWSRLIYPDISPAFSGGKLIKIRLVVEDTDNTEMLAETGVTLDGHVSSPLGLIDDTGERLIVLLKDGNVASIDKSLISSMVYVRSSTDTQDFSPALVTSPSDLLSP